MKKKAKPTERMHYEGEEVEREITYICPVRGKVTQKVKGYKLPYKGSPIEPKYTINLDEFGEELPDEPIPAP